MNNWIVTRKRPSEAAPSLSIGVEAGSTNVALIRFLERYPEQSVGTRVDIRVKGADWRDVTATYVRGVHRWDVV